MIFKVHKELSVFVATNELLDTLEWDETLDGLAKTIKMDLEFMWKSYAECDRTLLTVSAALLADKLRNLVDSNSLERV